MAVGKIALLGLRGLQFIFTVIVLGLGAHLIHRIDEVRSICNGYTGGSGACKHGLGSLPEASDYATFTGVWGLFEVIVGVIGAFVAAMPWFVAAAFDGLATIFFLAGGINSAVARVRHFNGCHLGGGYGYCAAFDADAAFMFFGFAASAIALALVFFARNSGSSRTSAV